MATRSLSTFVKLLVLVLGLLLLLPFAAGAQLETEDDSAPAADVIEPADEEAFEGKGIEEITVSARRREERLQDVPISVSAFSGTQLGETQTFNALDIQFQVPNMLFSKTNFTGANLQIRGIGTQVVAATAESAVAVHMNEVPVSASRIFEAEFYDVERIEVLRGPQGTLFGRNSTGGSYNVYTRKPTDEWGGDGEVMFGNWWTKRLRGAVNMPFHERFKMRVAGTFLDRDGFTSNLATGNDIDDRRLYALRGTLIWEPIDDTTVELMGSWFSEDDKRSRIGKQLCNRQEAFSPFSIGCQDGPQGFDTFPGYSTLGGILETYALAGINGAFALYPFVGVDPTYFFPQPLDSSIGAVNPPDLRTQDARIDPSYHADEGFVMLDLNHQMNDWTLSWLSGYQYIDVNSQQDYNMTRPGQAWDLGAVGALDAFIPTINACNGGTGLQLGLFGCVDRSAAEDDSRILSHIVSTEIRASSDLDGRLNYTAGTIFSYNHTSTDYFVYFTGAEVLGRILSAGDPLYNPELYHFNNETDPAETYSFGLFGEIYWDITDLTKLTVGGRYIYDKKEATSRNYLLDADPDTPGTQTQNPLTPDGLPAWNFQQADWNNGTFRVTLDQKLQLGFLDDSLVYGTVSRGFKPGGFNPPAATNVGTVPLTFDPEVVWAFEAGTKNQFWNDRAQANFTGFFYIYDGYQISSIVNRTAVNENIDAYIWGLELEYLLMPIDRLELSGSIAYLGSSIQDSFVIDTADPTAGVPGWVARKNLANGSNFICRPAVDAFCDPNVLATPANALDGIPKNLQGRELPNVPDVQIFVMARYTIDLPWDAQVIPRISYYWQNEMWGRMFNEERDLIPSWSELQAGIRYEDSSGRFMLQQWYVDLWIKNALNDDFITGHYFTDASSGNFTNVFLLDPRTYGITVGLVF